jgi:hypothetical protein
MKQVNKAISIKAPRAERARRTDTKEPKATAFCTVVDGALVGLTKEGARAIGANSAALAACTAEAKNKSRAVYGAAMDFARLMYGEGVRPFMLLADAKQVGYSAAHAPLRDSITDAVKAGRPAHIAAMLSPEFGQSAVRALAEDIKTERRAYQKAPTAYLAALRVNLARIDAAQNKEGGEGGEGDGDGESADAKPTKESERFYAELQAWREKARAWQDVDAKKIDKQIAALLATLATPTA